MPATALLPKSPLEATPEPVPNTYGVQVKLWRRWSPQAREVFNWLYHAMTANQHFYRHPRSPVEPPEVWGTTAWNAAYEAAEAVRLICRRV